MNIEEAIILVGGFGTRLAGAIAGIPKPMADIDGRPFLEILIARLAKNGIERAILATGYKSRLIEDYFLTHPQPMEIAYSVEDEPLGTGGSIRKAVTSARGDHALVVNGDTIFDFDIQALYGKHLSLGADASLSLKFMPDCSRYGRVEIQGDGAVTEFGKKGSGARGLINAGTFILRKGLLDGMPAKFSFEEDFLSRRVGQIRLFGHRFEGYFIDIGIPEDYEKAKRELA